MIACYGSITCRKNNYETCLVIDSEDCQTKPEARKNNKQEAWFSEFVRDEKWLKKCEMLSSF